MTTALTVAAVAAAGLALSLAVAIPTGRYLHRAAHRHQLVEPRDCPPWCVRERVAALHPGRGRRRHRLHRPGLRKSRLRHLIRRDLP